jgi:hypothetical protein
VLSQTVWRTRRLSCDISNIAIVNIFYRIQEKIINKIYFFKVRKINKIYRIFIYLFISDIFFTSPGEWSVGECDVNIWGIVIVIPLGNMSLLPRTLQEDRFQEANSRYLGAAN